MLDRCFSECVRTGLGSPGRVRSQLQFADPISKVVRKGRKVSRRLALRRQPLASAASGSGSPHRMRQVWSALATALGGSRMLQRTSTDKRRWVRALALAIVPVAATSMLGQLATYPNLERWYSALEKPSFNPANWVFAPVWTTLYILMAYAAWRLLILPARTPGRLTALALFYVQLALNALWSWMFFAMQSPVAGLVTSCKSGLSSQRSRRPGASTRKRHFASCRSQRGSPLRLY